MKIVTIFGLMESKMNLGSILWRNSLLILIFNLFFVRSLHYLIGKVKNKSVILNQETSPVIITKTI